MGTRNGEPGTGGEQEHGTEKPAHGTEKPEHADLETGILGQTDSLVRIRHLKPE